MNSSQDYCFAKIEKKWKSQEVSEGDGVMVNRVIGIKQCPDIDPFLMLDHLKKALLPSGFPDHPHRGFETVTYIIKGKFLHEDFTGNKGEIAAGDVQWMTAGKGIVHAEMPFSDTIESSGFQLWINLSKENKLIDPYYQEIKKDKIPVVKDKNRKYQITIIAGNFEDIIGPCKSTTPTSFYDITIESNGELIVPVYESSGLIYVFEGGDLNISDDKTTLNQFDAAKFTSLKSNGALKFNAGSEQSRFLLIFAKALNEPISKYGPFVMNTQDEIQNAFYDYQNSKNGFENRDKWQSKIREMGEL